MSGSSGTGFTFTAPALFFDGQNVGGNFNFALPQVAAASATDAYNFVAGASDAAYGFEGGAIASQNAYNFGLYNTQTNYLNQIGTIFADAADSASKKISSGGGGGIFGWLF